MRPVNALIRVFKGSFHNNEGKGSGGSRLEEVSLTIDGRSVRARVGATVMEAAGENGIRIPSLCHHPELKPAGACRICLVEDEASGRMLASCVTPVAKDMALRTDSEAVIRHRRNIVRLLMANHPESCIVCDQGNACGLREIAAELGIGSTGLYPMKRHCELEQANAFISRDLSKCILCGRCIRADHELVVVGAIDYHFRGFDALPATLHEGPLDRSDCTFCGTCISMCPTGALRPRNQGHAGSPEKWTASVCGFCGIGCSLELGTAGDVLVDVQPSGGPETPNRSTLCVRGHFEQDYVNAKERLRTPGLGRGQERKAAGWDQALEKAAGGLREIRNHYGPQSIAFLGSARCSLEENYLFQKIARALIGTNNVLSGLPGWEAALPEDPEPVLPASGPVATLNDVEQAEAVVVIGADPTESMPVLGYAVKRAARRKGTPVVVLDPRKTDLVKFSAAWIPVRPGRDSEVIDALAALLIDSRRMGGSNPGGGGGAPGLAEYLEGLRALDVGAVEEAGGLPAGCLERASRVLAGREIVFVVGHGILEQDNAHLPLLALRDLARITGRGAAAESSMIFLSRENNRVGALDMGSAPAMLPGRIRLSDPEGRRLWERVWGVRLSPDPGVGPARLVPEMELGNIKALWVMGENPLSSLPQRPRVREAMEGLELLVVQDILETELSGMADVLLPAAAFSEKQGAFTSVEGRIRELGQAADPPGRALPDWAILARLYDLLAASPGGYGSVSSIRKEIRDHVPGYRGLGVSPGGDGAWVERRPPQPESAARFHAPALAARGADDREYPWTVILGGIRNHLGSGTRTSHSRRLRTMGLAGDLEISPGDAAGLGVSEGETALVISGWGRLERRVRLSDRLGPGTAYLPTGVEGNNALDLLGPSEGRRGASAGWKHCRARIQRAEK